MKSIAFAFMVFGFYPAVFSHAKEEIPAGVPQSGPADASARAEKSTSPVSSVKIDYKDMVLIPTVEFMMGSSDEEGYPNEHPRHKVSLAPYFMDKYEVPAVRYRAFAKATGRQVHEQPCRDKDNCPVVYVNWNDAGAYCGYYGKRLPTEAEWENAARAGSEGKYCFGSDETRLGEYAWYWNNSGRQLHPVGQKKPNRYGIYDMHGNALEWVSDWYGESYYGESPGVNPAGPAEGEAKSVRGGSAFVSAELCRAAHRMRSSPDNGYSGRGFRCAASAPKQ